MDEKLKSEEAARLLSNDVLQNALKDLRDETIAQWSVCPARDTEAREWLWMFYQNTLRFETVLKGYLATGKILEFNKKQATVVDRLMSTFKKG